jgi:hypothetical protein
MNTWVPVARWKTLLSQVTRSAGCPVSTWEIQKLTRMTSSVELL